MWVPRFRNSKIYIPYGASRNCFTGENIANKTHNGMIIFSSLIPCKLVPHSLVVAQAILAWLKLYTMWYYWAFSTIFFLKHTHKHVQIHTHTHTQR